MICWKFVGLPVEKVSSHGDFTRYKTDLYVVLSKYKLRICWTVFGCGAENGNNFPGTVTVNY